jgi:hypothetical protein
MFDDQKGSAGVRLAIDYKLNFKLIKWPRVFPFWGVGRNVFGQTKPVAVSFGNNSLELFSHFMFY